MVAIWADAGPSPRPLVSAAAPVAASAWRRVIAGEGMVMAVPHGCLGWFVLPGLFWQPLMGGFNHPNAGLAMRPFRSKPLKRRLAARPVGAAGSSGTPGIRR